MTVPATGVVSVRRRGDTRTFAAGESLVLDELSAMLRGERASARRRAPTAPARERPRRRDGAAPGAVAARRGRRGAGRLRRGVRRAATSTVAWPRSSASSRRSPTGRPTRLQSDDADEARRALRALVVRLGELAEQGAADPRGQVAPFVELLLQLRAAARDTKDFATSDLVRDRLAEAGVEVRDAADGTSWSLTTARARAHPVVDAGRGRARPGTSASSSGGRYTPKRRGSPCAGRATRRPGSSRPGRTPPPCPRSRPTSVGGAEVDPVALLAQPGVQVVDGRSW